MFDLRRTVRRGAVEHHGDLEALVSNRLQDQMTHVGATPLRWWQTVKEIISVNQQRHQRLPAFFASFPSEGGEVRCIACHRRKLV
jgi:hypothetical protein